MKIQGTIIERDEDVFGVFLVTINVLETPQKRQEVLDSLEEFFPEIPLVLLAPQEGGSPAYHGPHELVDAIRDRPFFGFLWREYILE